MSDEIKTCGGYCCEKFRIGRIFDNLRTVGGFSPEQLKAHAERPGASKDDKLIYEMAIYLGVSTTDSCGGEGAPCHWYTCKHFDTQTRLCKIYEERPDICRSFNEVWSQPCGLAKCRLPRLAPPDLEPKSNEDPLRQDEERKLLV